jgi:uncharacterized membrane protein YkgB
MRQYKYIAKLARFIPMDKSRGLRAGLGSLIRFVTIYGILLIRLAVAITFVWFGSLKIIGRSPVGDLVAATVYWFPAEVFVPILGVWEVVVGLGLLFRVALRLTLLLFWLQLTGTFLVLVLHPELAFQYGNPLLLTMTGEFVIKNLVLIAAGIVIGSTVQRKTTAHRAV